MLALVFAPPRTLHLGILVLLLLVASILLHDSQARRTFQTSMSNPLDPSALLSVLPTLLPKPQGTEGDAATVEREATLRHPQDALAAIVHTIMSRLDFRLVGLSDDDSERLPSSSSAESASSGPTSPASILPAAWNSKAPDQYTFRYKHDQSSLEYLLKIVKLGKKAVIHGIALQATKTSTLELEYDRYFSPSFWPYPNNHHEPLVNGFISSSRVQDLVIAFKTQILQTLVPGLRKDGYIEDTAADIAGNRGGSSSGPSAPAGGSGSYPPSRGPNAPRPPFQGDEDDPTLPAELNQPARNPLIIGDTDLDPLAANPLQLPPRFGGGGSFGPPPLFPGGGRGGDTGGGMFVGPNHPIFRDRFPPHGQGSGSFPAPGSVPPGARFDPIFPSGDGSFPGAQGPRFDPNNPDVGGALPQNPPRGGGGGRATGEPDWDDLAPPRFGGGFGGSNNPSRRGPPGAGGSDHWYA